MSAAEEHRPRWVKLEAEAERRGMTPRELWTWCKRLSVTINGGKVSTAVVSPVEIDAAFDRKTRALAANDADHAEYEHAAAQLPKLKRR